MKKCTTYTIGKTTIEKLNDDFSESYHYLGEYTDKIGPGIIIREYDEFYERIKTEMERNDDGTFYGKKDPVISSRYYSNEYRGFKPTNHIPHNPKNWSHVKGNDRKEVIKKYGSVKNADYAYAMQDYHRMESLNAGQWSFIGIIVKTQITTDTGLSDEISDALWGIESDCTEYHKEVIQDLKYEVKDQLLKMGFNEIEIDLSLDNTEERD